jgi:hypothetical protein
MLLMRVTNLGISEVNQSLLVRIISLLKVLRHKVTVACKV